MLLGRSRELAHIDGMLQRAATEGASAAVVVVGEAGIGKSALGDAAADSAAGRGTTILRTCGIESDSTIPFAGLGDLLRPVQDLVAELPGPQAAALAGALALGPPASQDRFAVAAATLSLLAAASQGGSLLCLVDDAHWLDPSSAEALVFAARRMRAEASVIVFTVRADEPGAVRFRDMDPLPLGGLDDAPAAELLTRGAGRTLPPEVSARLLADTGGNPLALLEVPGQLSEDQLSGRVPILEPLPVGSLLMEGFLRRVRDLPDAARTALLLAATSDIEAADLVDRALRDAGGALDDLHPAEAAGLVTLDGGRLRFRHPLVRSAVYHAAEPARRRDAHRRLADALDQVPAPQAHDRQAWHLAAATVTSDEAVATKLETLGHDALGRHSHAVATRALERAAELSPEPGDRARRLLSAASAAVPAGYIQEAVRLLGEAEGWTDDPVAAAVAECERHRLGVWAGDAEASRARLFAFAESVEAALPPVAVRAYLAAAQASLFAYDVAGIARSARRAAALAGDDDVVALRCDVFSAFAAAQSGERERAAELLTRRRTQLAVHDTFEIDQLVTMSGVCHVAIEDTAGARPLLARAVEASRTANAAGLLAVQLPWLAALDWVDGEWTSALALAHEAVLLAPETGWLAQLPNSLSTLARVEAGFGMADECRTHAEQAARAPGGDATRAHAHAAVGLLELGQPDRADEAAAAMERAWAAATDRDPEPAPLLAAQLLPDLAEARLRAGHATEAAEALARLDKIAANIDRHLARACSARLHGLSTRTGFAAHFETALRHHDRGGPAFERARTHLAYGARLRRTRDRAAARTQLERAVELFERLGAKPWAARARAELVGSGGSAPAPNDLIELTLTPQELQVSLAVRKGLTNVEVASSLFLSVKTVEYHLSNVYRKLGVRSRTQLIRVLGEDRTARAPLV